MKTYELNYGNKATVNLGDYENLSPMYNEKLIITVEDGIEINIAEELEKMRAIVDEQLRLNVLNIRNAKKAKDIGNFRFYTKDGKQYISVTSVLNPEPKTPEDEARLKPYGDRGTALHRIFAHLIENGELTSPTAEEKELCSSVGGFLGYEFWFKKDERFDFRGAEREIFNDELQFAGRYDADGYFYGQPALFDLKSGSLDKSGIDKAFLQLSAYNASLETPKEVLVIIPVGPKSKKEPIITEGEKIKVYWDLFKIKRQAFRDKYGV